MVCGGRSGDCEKLSQMKEYAENVLNLKKDEIVICESEPIEISSTEIRDSLKNGEADFLDGSIYEYIKTRGLYCE